MTLRWTVPLLPALLAVGCAAPVSPQAKSQLVAMADTLRQANELSFVARVQAPIDATIRYRLRRPDRLRCDITRDGAESVILFDRGKLTCSSTRLKVSTSVDGFAADIDSAVDAAGAMFGRPLPLGELLANGLAQHVIPRLTSAQLRGEETVGGDGCVRVDLVLDDTEWSVWIRTQAPHLPRRLRGHSTEHGLRIEAELGEWSLEPKLTDADFTYRPPAGVREVEPERLVEVLRAQGGTKP